MTVIPLIQHLWRNCPVSLVIPNLIGLAFLSVTHIIFIRGLLPFGQIKVCVLIVDDGKYYSVLISLCGALGGHFKCIFILRFIMINFWLIKTTCTTYNNKNSKELYSAYLCIFNAMLICLVFRICFSIILKILNLCFNLINLF